MGRSVTPNTANPMQPVTSAVGFLSGDLVYETTSGISRIPDNAVSTGIFPASGTVADYRYSSVSSGNLKYVENVGGGQFAPSAARLTNGNIVIAYGVRTAPTNNTADVFFKILDVNDNVVVAQTTVTNVAGGVYLQFGSAGVLALPNGGFAVIMAGFDGTNRRISYRVYNASGAPQTALITDTSIALPSGSFQLAFAARSDSSFVVAFLDSSLNPTYRVYSAAGSTVYSGTFGFTVSSGGNRNLAVVVRSDNSYVLVSNDANNATVRYSIFSSTNTSLSASTFNVSSGNAQYIDAVLLASDVVGIGAYSSAGAVFYRSITGTTLSSESTLIGGFTASGASGFAMAPFASGSRFIVTYTFTSTSTTAQAYTNSFKFSYAVFNSSGAVVSATQSFKGISMYTARQTPAFVEVGSTLRFYMSSISTWNTGAPSFCPKGIYYGTISTTNFLAIPQQTFSFSAGNTPAQPVSGYVRATATPSSAQFFASTTSTVVSTFNQSTSSSSTQVFPKTVLDSFQVSSTAACYLGNGTYAVAYMASSSSAVRVQILNSSGTILNTITPGAGSAGATGAIRICRLGNGRIVVAYKASTTQVDYRVYSPAYALLLSGSITGLSGSGVGQFGLSPLGSESLTNNLFVITTFNSSNFFTYAVYADNSTTPVASGNVDASGNPYQTTDVVGLRSGDFFVGGYSSAYGGYRISYFAFNGTSSWSQVWITNAPGSSAGASNISASNCFLTADDQAVFTAYDGSSVVYFYQVAAGNGGSPIPTVGQATTFGATSGDARIGISCTGEGDMFYVNGATTGGGASAGSYPMPLGFQNMAGLSVSSFYPIPNAGGAANIALAPSFNNSAIYVTLDSSTAFPVAAVVYPINGSLVTNLTAGVSACNAITLTPTRYVLKGVAATTCAPGGSGLVQTSGVAQLNTQYSSLPSQPFDFTNQIITGVRGIVSGRTVTIEG